MNGLAKRLAALERRAGAGVIGIRWHDANFVSVKGVEIPLAEFGRLYPDAITVHLTWGDDPPAPADLPA